MAAAGKPNVVFIVGDNVGWGDFSVYGGTTPTPRIDALANAGIRFNNYNVEGQCTPMLGAALKPVGEYGKSVAAFPNIKPGEEFKGYR